MGALEKYISPKRLTEKTHENSFMIYINVRFSKYIACNAKYTASGDEVEMVSRMLL